MLKVPNYSRHITYLFLFLLLVGCSAEKASVTRIETDGVRPEEVTNLDMSTVLRHSGTHFLASDFQDEEAFNKEKFQSGIKATLNAQQERKEQALSASGTSISSSRSGGHRVTPEEEAERERIKKLFQDQSPSALSTSSRSQDLSPEEQAEKERIQQLFFDQQGVERPSDDPSLTEEEQLERERIQRLFEDQGSAYSSVRVSAGGGGTCRRDRSLLAIFSEDLLFCGNEGWTFPGLIDGDCPISFCILKTSPNDDFFGQTLN